MTEKHDLEKQMQQLHKASTVKGFILLVCAVLGGIVGAILAYLVT